jgi:hypothetical protein
VIADDHCRSSRCLLEEIKGVRVLVTIRLGDGAEAATFVAAAALLGLGAPTQESYHTSLFTESSVRQDRRRKCLNVLLTNEIFIYYIVIISQMTRSS